MAKKSTTEKFIAKAKLVPQHQGKGYDYSKVKYIAAPKKVEIVCPEHGSFWQVPNSHLKGHGCLKCYNDRLRIRMSSTRLSNEDFVRRALNIDGNKDKFSYTRVNYLGSSIKVEIVCLKHGPFWQRPDKHLNGDGCKICSNKNPVNNEMVDLKLLRRGILRLGDVFGVHNKILWRCLSPQCDNIWPARPADILKGRGCPACKITGFNPSKPSVIYVYNINDDYCGYGITNDFKTRDTSHQNSFKKSGVTAELVTTYECSGTEAERIENLLKNTFEVTNTGIKGFKTEATYLHNLPALLELIKNNAEYYK